MPYNVNDYTMFICCCYIILLLLYIYREYHWRSYVCFISQASYNINKKQYISLLMSHSILQSFPRNHQNTKPRYNVIGSGFCSTHLLRAKADCCTALLSTKNQQHCPLKRNFACYYISGFLHKRNRNFLYLISGHEPK